ncbi:hypothetical protein D3C76_993520 [compost metagenome]
MLVDVVEDLVVHRDGGSRLFQVVTVQCTVHRLCELTAVGDPDWLDAQVLHLTLAAEHGPAVPVAHGVFGATTGHLLPALCYAD